MWGNWLFPKREKEGERLPACEQTVINLTFPPSHTLHLVPSLLSSGVPIHIQFFSSSLLDQTNWRQSEHASNRLLYIMSPTSWTCTFKDEPEHLYEYTLTHAQYTTTLWVQNIQSLCLLKQESWQPIKQHFVRDMDTQKVSSLVLQAHMFHNKILFI